VNRIARLISIVVCLLTCAGCQHHMVVLETDLQPAKFDRTQKPRQKSGEKFLVPQGTKLLSRGVKVTNDYDDPIMDPIIGKLEMITDGNKEGNKEFLGWYYEYVVELCPSEWVQLDLGKSYALYAILVWHYYSPESYDHRVQCPHCDMDNAWPREYQDVVVQISNDPAFKKDVITVFNNDHDNSSGLGKGKDDTYVETSEGRWINPKGVEGRYVRLYSRGYSSLPTKDSKDDPSKYSPMNHYIEVEVYGK
jgi:hypothetical protein